MAEEDQTKQEGNSAFINKLNLIVTIAIAVLSLVAVGVVYFSGKHPTKESQQVETPAEAQPLEEPQEQQSQSNKQINL